MQIRHNADGVSGSQYRTREVSGQKYSCRNEQAQVRGRTAHINGINLVSLLVHFVNDMSRLQRDGLGQL